MFQWLDESPHDVFSTESKVELTPRDFSQEVHRQLGYRSCLDSEPPYANEKKLKQNKIMKHHKKINKTLANKHLYKLKIPYHHFQYSFVFLGSQL